MFNDILKSITTIYKKSSTWAKIFFIVLLFLIVITIFKQNKKTEGFIQSDQFLFKNGPLIYDDFYVNIYDHLVYNNIKNKFEIGEIINATKPSEESIILDIGSGPGHHVALLQQLGFKNVIGIDQSLDMVKKAKANYPDYDFIQQDILNAASFHSNSFTHILCLYFTIYYINDKQLFFDTCFDLLMGGGYLVVHIVDREKFNPILPAANPLLLLSPQKYAENRITNSNITFDNFKYEANFDLDPANNNALFIEKFKNKDSGKVFRKNEHQFYMEPAEAILAIAQSSGFVVQGKINMVSAGYESQYLYLFYKPE
jgi:SAM-dependent methyltransferase